MTASAQDFSLGLGGADRMLRDGILPAGLFDPLLDPTMEGFIKGDVQYSLSATATYTSNASMADGGDDDVILSLNPTMAYTTDPEGGARHMITAYYSPSYRTYLESSRGGLNHNGGVSYSTSGARASIGAFLNVAQSSGADRLTSGYSESTIYSGGISASYQVAPRTNVWSSFTTARSKYSTSGRDSENYSAQLGFNWAATELLNIGPSLRYTRTESDNTGTREATGLLFNAGYAATERIRLNTSIGVEMVENSRQSGGSSASLTGDFGLGYRINELWSTHASIRYGNIPSPNNAGYMVNDLSFQISVNRALLYGSIGAGARYSISEYERVGPVTVAREDEESFSIFLSYRRPLFSDRVGFSSSAEYSRSDGSRDWSQWSITSGLTVSF